MDLKPFKLERYFGKYEFSVKYLLSSSDCDGLAMSEVVAMADQETRKLWSDLRLGYTESSGLPLLRQEIARLYSNSTPDDVLVTNPEEGVFVVLNSILKPGDHVVAMMPGYQSHTEVVTGLGCALTPWQPDESAGWKFDPAFLEQAITPATKLIIVNFPHNPTGYLPSRADFDRIVATARRHDCYLFSDEMYRLLEFDERERLPAACDVYEKAVTLFGMSKTFGLAGLRIGWLVTQDEDLYQRMAAFKDYTSICNSAPSEILALIGLRNKDTITKRHLGRIERNLKILDGFFTRYADRFSWVRPHAGTIGLARLHGIPSAHDFCEKMVQETGIMLLPSTVYDYGDQHVRIGFGRENMPEVLERLENHLSAK